MSFSGFILAQLQSDNAPEGVDSLLAQLDLLVDGPFVSSQAIRAPNSFASDREWLLESRFEITRPLKSLAVLDRARSTTGRASV